MNSSVKVLLVFGSVLVLSRVSDVLRKRIPGISQMVANTASEASELLADNHFDVIVMDIHLPDENGIKFLGNLSLQHPLTTLIVFTSDAEPAIKKICIENGAHKVFADPSDLTKAIDFIKKYQKTKTKRK